MSGVIHPLPEDLVKLLRSGVAITDLSHCVEELVFNALDAEATHITVSLDLPHYKIQVEDNGIGIPFDQLKHVGERYLTSKCSTLEDLNHLKWYGFRGEAIASLRALCGTIEIETRPKNCKDTFYRLFDHGKPAVTSVLSSSCRTFSGTTVTIQNFMYNLPVRQRSISQVLDVEICRQRLQAVALANPTVSLTLRNDATKDMCLHTRRCSTTISVFSQLFGHSRASQLKEAVLVDGIYKVEGFISTEGHTSKNLQFIYVNRRLVLKTKVHKMFNWYLGRYLFSKPKGSSPTKPKETSSPIKSSSQSSPRKNHPQYGIFVLNVSCPFNVYDICFEPRKMVVEFKEWNKVMKIFTTLCISFLKVHGHYCGNVDDLDFSEGEKKDEKKDKTDVADPKCVSVDSIVDSSKNIDITDHAIISHAAKRNWPQKNKPDINIRMGLELDELHESNEANTSDLISPFREKFPLERNMNENTAKTGGLHLSKRCERPEGFQLPTISDEPPIKLKAKHPTVLLDTLCERKRRHDSMLALRQKFGFVPQKKTVRRFNTQVKAVAQASKDVKDDLKMDIEAAAAAALDITNTQEDGAKLSPLDPQPHYSLEEEQLECASAESTPSVISPRTQNLPCSPSEDDDKIVADLELQNRSTHLNLVSFQEIVLNKMLPGMDVPLSLECDEVSGKGGEGQEDLNDNAAISGQDSYVEPIQCEIVVSDDNDIENQLSSETNSKIFLPLVDASITLLSESEQNSFKSSSSSPEVIDKANDSILDLSITPEYLTVMNDSASELLPQCDPPVVELMSSPKIIMDDPQLKEAETAFSELQDSVNLTGNIPSEDAAPNFEVLSNTDSILCWKDKESGQDIYLDTKTGNSFYELPPSLNVGSDDMNGGSDSSETHNLTSNENVSSFLRRLDTRQKFGSLGATTEALLLSKKLLDEAQMESSFENHLVKWNESSKKEIIELYQNWKNPVFRGSDFQEVQDCAVNKNSQNVVRAYGILSPYKFSKQIFDSIEVIGQLDCKFIVGLLTVKNKNNSLIDDRLIVLLDQHAVHERIRLEQLLDDLPEGKEGNKMKIKSSLLYPPLKINVGAEVGRLTDFYVEEFKRVGLQISTVQCAKPDSTDLASSTSVLTVQSLPSCLMEKFSGQLRKHGSSIISSAVEDFVKEQIQAVQETRVFPEIPKTIHNTLCSHACRGAVKFGDPLSKDECCQLVQLLSHCKLPFQCAHGRPSLTPLVDLNELKLLDSSKKSAVPNLQKLRKEIERLKTLAMR